ncbi:MAG TPA: hypothetical protein VLI69_09115 [Gammaproteobacteria bacterium]|nr:hypothetical protein [Gammaproteobacteria bacterium]
MNNRKRLHMNAIASFLKRTSISDKKLEASISSPPSPPSLTGPQNSIPAVSSTTSVSLGLAFPVLPLPPVPQVSAPLEEGETITMQLGDFLGNMEETDKKVEEEKEEKKDVAFDMIEKLNVAEFNDPKYSYYKEQLGALYESFMMIKKCMNIPSKKVREDLADATSLNSLQAIQLRLILQDKIVLHHVQFIDDIVDLVKMVMQIKNISSEDQLKELKRQFDNKIKYTLNEIHHKEEYLKVKQQNLENLNLQKIEHAFDAYCKDCSYHLFTYIPDLFQCDDELQRLSKEEEKLHTEFNEKLSRYVDNDLVTDRRLKPTAFLQYTQTSGERMQAGVEDLSESMKKLKDRAQRTLTSFTNLREHSAAIELTVGSQRTTTLIDALGQQLLDDDPALKNKLKDIRARVSVLRKAEAACHEKKLELERLQSEIQNLISRNDLKSSLGNLLEGSTNLLLEFNKSQQSDTKDLEDFYKNEKNIFELEIIKLTTIQTNIVKLIEQKSLLSEEKAKQTDLINAIDHLERKLEIHQSLSVSLDNAVNKFKQLKQEMKEWTDSLSAKELDTLLKEHDEALKKRQTKTAELEKVHTQLQQYELARDHLKGKVLNSQQIDARFEYIKAESLVYWGQAMRVQFESQAEAAVAQVERIEQGYARLDEQLDKTVQDAGFTAKLLSGIKPVAIGAGIGAAIGGGSSLLSLNPFSAVFSAGVGAIVGGAIGGVLYRSWLSGQNAHDTKELRAQFLKEMKEVGFNNAEYKALINDVLKLLVFRDCLLLNEKIDKKAARGLRSQFIIDNNLQDLSKEEIDLAIEVFFQKKLNELINENFIRIFELHEKDIENAKNENSVWEFLKKLTKGAKEYSKKRQVCTAQMQIAFLEGVAHCLDTSRNIPSTRYRRFSRLTTTVFLGAAIGLGVAIGLAALPFSLVTGAIIGSCILGAIAVQLAGKFSYFKYKRSQQDRKTLQATAIKMKAESKRLEILSKEVMNTGLVHQTSLKKFQGINTPGFFQRIHALYTHETIPEQVAMGTADVWLREYSERYRHSVFMEVDFQTTLKPLVERAARQTQDLQQELLAHMMMRNAQQQHDYPLLKKYIRDTQAFLKAKDGKQAELRAMLAELFNIQEKIKEQVLEIVSVVTMNNGNLPVELVNFYVDVLHGSRQDLDAIRRLNSLEAIRIAAGEIKQVAAEEVKQEGEAKQVQERLKSRMEDQSLPILAGSDSYRVKMGAHNNNGWGEAPDGLICSDGALIKPMTSENIQKYLEDSLTFLLSLDLRGGTPPVGLDVGYTHSSQYMIYRAMLLKQLAELVDPAHKKYQPALKDKILSFAEKSLLLDNPKRFFSEMQHQDRVVPQRDDAAQPAEAKEDKNELGKTFNDSIVDATRVSITYDKKEMTARRLIEQYVVPSTLVQSSSLFGLNGKILAKLGIPTSQTSLMNLQKTISHTEKLFHAILIHPRLISYKAHEVYLRAALEHIDQLNNQILERERQGQLNGKEIANLTAGKKALELHKMKLQLMRGLIENDIPAPLRVGENLLELKLCVISHRPSRSYNLFNQSAGIPFGPAANEPDDVIKSAFLKALSQHAGSDKHSQIEFNLASLNGDTPWKKACRDFLSSILSESDKALFTEGNQQRLAM